MEGENGVTSSFKCKNCQAFEQSCKVKLQEDIALDTIKEDEGPIFLPFLWIAWFLGTFVQKKGKVSGRELHMSSIQSAHVKKIDSIGQLLMKGQLVGCS